MEDGWQANVRKVLGAGPSRKDSSIGLESDGDSSKVGQFKLEPSMGPSLPVHLSVSLSVYPSICSSVLLCMGMSERLYA